jgi:hypothetical protein
VFRALSAAEQPMINLAGFLPVCSCVWADFRRMMQVDPLLWDITCDSFKAGKAVGAAHSFLFLFLNCDVSQGY